MKSMIYQTNVYMRSPAAGYVLGIVGAMLFSLKAVFIKLAYVPAAGLAMNELPSISLLALRMGYVLPFYAMIGLFVAWRMKHAGEKLPGASAIIKAALTGVLGYYICSYTDIYGLKFITAQLERLLLFTYPLFVFLIGAAFFGQKLTARGIMAVIVAYAGIAVIFLRGDIAIGENVLLGSTLVMICAVLFALFQLLAKEQVDKIGSTLFTCIAMSAAGTLAVTHFTVSNVAAGTLGEALDLPVRIYVLAALIAFVSTLIPSFLINIALGRIGAPSVAALGMIGPVATIFFAIGLLGEPFGLIDALGTALTVLGIGFYTLADRRQNRARSVAAAAAMDNPARSSQVEESESEQGHDTDGGEQKRNI